MGAIAAPLTTNTTAAVTGSQRQPRLRARRSKATPPAGSSAV
jgi:hypothetical protein